MNTKCCLTCAYCVDISGREPLPVNKGVRKGDFSHLNDRYRMCCLHGHWSELVYTPKREKLKEYKCKLYCHYKIMGEKLPQGFLEEQKQTKQHKVLLWTIVAALAALLAAQPVIKEAIFWLLSHINF